MSMMLTLILLLSAISFEVFAENPKVSIIIPVFNTPENLLRDCLESAKNQTLKDIEIICVDDGSTDGSGKILNEYAKSDPRFKVFHQKNEGASVARNNGMKMAKGEYIQLLDSDDRIDLTMSEKCYNAAKDYDADIVKCNCADQNGGMGYVNLKNFCGTMPRFKFLGGRNYIFVWNGIHKKSYLDRYNIRFPDRTAYGEDYMFNFMLVMQDYRLVWIDQVLYKKNWTENSISLTIKRQNKEKNWHIHGCRYLYNYIKNEYPGCFEYTDFFFEILLNCDDVSLADINSIDSELLSDDVVNRLPTAERVRLKSMMLIANQKTKPQKTLDDGIYTISSKLDSNKCLAIKDGSKNNCANLQLLDRNGTDAQKFKVQYNPDRCYTIKAMCSGKMLDVLGGSKNILQCTKNKRNSQKWFIVPDGEGFYCLVSKSNDSCMTVDDANVCCLGVHGGDNQRFKLEKCGG